MIAGMASIGHIAVGLVASRHTGQPRSGGVGAALLLSILSLLPDVDVVAFRLGIPYSAPFGHRGATHSLAAALACGVIAGALWAWLGRRGPGAAILTCTAVVASHGLLDMLTDGGLGVALLWPFSDERFFAPWRPLPVAPIGRRLLSARGLSVLGREALLFLPAWLYALWPRGARPAQPAPARSRDGVAGA